MKRSDNIEVLARKEWDRLKAVLELKCKDFMVKKDSNQVAFIAPGKKLTFTFDSDSTQRGNETCSLEAKTTRDVTQYFFRLSEEEPAIYKVPVGVGTAAHSAECKL